jgi:hypothetical protein
MPAPVLNPTLSWSSEAESGKAVERMDNERLCAEYGGEAVITGGVGETSDNDYIETTGLFVKNGGF